MKVYTTFIHSASITRGVTYAKLTHTGAEGRYTTAPYIFPASSPYLSHSPLDTYPFPNPHQRVNTVTMREL